MKENESTNDGILAEIENLRKKEELLRRAEEVAQIGYWEFLLDEGIVRTSEGADIIYGLGQQTWTIQDAQRIPLPEYRASLDRALADLIQSGAPYNIEFKIRRNTDGEIRDIHSIAEFKTAERIVFGVIHDVTENKRAVEALHASEARFRLIAENASALIGEFDPQGRFLYANSAYHSALGYDPQELVGTSAADYLYPDEVDLANKEYAELVEHPGVRRDIWKFRHKNGEARWFECMANNYQTSAGETRLIVISTDISDRKRAEEDLHAKNREYRFLVDAAQTLITFATVDHVYRFISRALTELYPACITVVNKITADREYCECINILGITDAQYQEYVELIGYQPLGRRYKIDPQKPSGYFKTNIKKHSLDFSEFAGKAFTPAAGRRFQEALSIQDIYTVGISTPEMNFGNIHILTTRPAVEINAPLIETFVFQCALSLVRISAQEALRESEDKFRQLADHIQQVFWLRNKEGYLYISPAYETVWGRTCASLMEDPGTFFEAIHPEDRGRILQLLQERAYLDDGRFDEEFRIIHPAAGVRWVWVRSYPIMDENGEIVRRAGIGEDITERKSLTEKMIDSQKMADIGTLAAGVAHEINNPLQVITGTSDSLIQVLQEGASLPADYLEHKLYIISRNSWRIADIVRSLNLYARSNRQEAFPYQINDLIRDTLLLIEHQTLNWTNIQINLDLRNDLPVFLCDRNNITQVLINLLTNARDAMPAGGEITIISRYLTDSEEIMLAVQDTGSGIPAEIRDRIFTPFFTTKPVGSGAGLGLPIVQNIVKHYGGRIEVGCAPFGGAIFKLYFPLGLAEVENEENSLLYGRYIENPPDTGML